MILFGILVIVNVSTKKAAKLTTEECDKIIDDISQKQNNINNKKKKIENCKPYVASSVLFVSVSIILSGTMIYFCVKSRNRDVLP